MNVRAHSDEIKNVARDLSTVAQRLAKLADGCHAVPAAIDCTEVKSYLVSARVMLREVENKIVQEELRMDTILTGGKNA